MPELTRARLDPGPAWRRQAFPFDKRGGSFNVLERMIGLLAVACSQLVGALGSLDGKPRYIHHGWFQISVANLVVIVLMIVMFVLALFLRFPGEREKR